MGSGAFGLLVRLRFRLRLLVDGGRGGVASGKSFGPSAPTFADKISLRSTSANFGDTLDTTKLGGKISAVIAPAASNASFSSAMVQPSLRERMNVNTDSALSFVVISTLLLPRRRG